MKGGITSGVIYPGAVCELAKTYRLRSIGGASAAPSPPRPPQPRNAGERRVVSRSSNSCPTTSPRPRPWAVRRCSGCSSPPGRPRGCSPSRPARRVASGAARILAPLGVIMRHFARRCSRAACRAPSSSPSGSLASGLASGAAIVAGRCCSSSERSRWRGRGRVAGRALPVHGFGLCSGMPGAAAFRRAAALTPWLHELLQKLAGRGTDEAPSPSATSTRRLRPADDDHEPQPQAAGGPAVEPAHLVLRPGGLPHLVPGRRSSTG